MSGRTGPNATVYVDVATQTSPFTSPPPISPACPASPITSFLTATSLYISNDSCSPIQNTSKREDTHPSSNECMPAEHSCGLDVASSRLPSFPSSFALQRETGMRATHTNTRTVSLPESLCDQELRLALSQLAENTSSECLPQSRVVSMPVNPRKARSPASPASLDHHEPRDSSLDDLHLEIGQELSESSDSVTSTPSTPRTVVMHSFTSDQLNTPSPPPSSCDSVEFTLEDPALLPDSFLRGTISSPIFVPEKASKDVALLDDDGWITWANSPPRPIPALHGPSSLPYARCPSGAEGTIIEEQASMPRMIWGLDPNDIVPGPQAPHQQSRAVAIKSPSEIARAPPFSRSAPVSFSVPSLAPRYGFGDTKYNRVQDLRTSKGLSAAPSPRLGERSEGIFRNPTGGGTGLGFIVAEDQVSPSATYNSSFRSGAPQFHSQQMLDTDIEMLSHEEIEEQRQRTSQSWNEKYGNAPIAISRGHPSDLIDLFSSPIKVPAHKLNPHSRAASTISAPDPPGYLPTPPNSSSPQWTSVFSPVKTGHFSTTNFASSGSDPSTHFKMLSKISTTHDELSHELRRFVFENMSSSNPAGPITSFGASPITNGSPMPYVFVPPNPSLIETPAHPPGIPIPNHILLSQLSLDPSDPQTRKGALSGTLAPTSPSTVSYRRSNLSNPRSIPLSRLRQNQKHEAVKLATVPEEDFEASAHDKWLVPPAQSRPRLALRTPSPLADRLRPRSVEEKATNDEEPPKVEIVRVKLPCNRECHAGDAPRDSDPNKSMPQGSPKKKRFQRRRKPATTKPTETGRGFPLISEGIVSFGSSDANGETSKARQ